MGTFLNLLPVAIRNQTNSWLTESVEEEVGLIKNQAAERAEQLRLLIRGKCSDPELLRQFLYYLGYDLFEGDGYTRSLTYLNRQLLSLLPRIKKKPGYNAYRYLNYIYEMDNLIYPLVTGVELELFPLTDFLNLYLDEDNITDDLRRLDEDTTNEDNITEPRRLDQEAEWILYYQPQKLDLTTPEHQMDKGLKMDDFTPVYANNPLHELWSLDFSLANTLTRHTAYYVIPRYVEATDEFYSFDTLTGLIRDVYWIKKTTEVPHFIYHFILFLPQVLNQALVLTMRDWRVDQQGFFKSVKISNFHFKNDVVKIELGSGNYSESLSLLTSGDNPIQDLVRVIDLDTDIRYEAGSDEFNLLVASKITPESRFFSPETASRYVSELTLRDADDNLLAYASFPKVYFNTGFLNSIRVLIRTAT